MQPQIMTQQYNPRIDNSLQRTAISQNEPSSSHVQPQSDILSQPSYTEACSQLLAQPLVTDRHESRDVSAIEQQLNYTPKTQEVLQMIQKTDANINDVVRRSQEHIECQQEKLHQLAAHKEQEMRLQNQELLSNLQSKYQCLAESEPSLLSESEDLQTSIARQYY